MGLAHSPSLVTNGLVLCLDAGNPKSYPGSGSIWNDISRQAISGTLTNMSSNYSNENGGMLNFDGVDEYVRFGSSIPLGNPFTVCAFIRLSESNSSTRIVYGPDANGEDNWLGVDQFNRIYFRGTEFVDVNNFNVYSSGVTLVISQWHFVCASVNSNTVVLYLDGKQVHTNTQAFTIASWTSAASVGRRGKVAQSYFKGDISTVMGYNRALSAAEVAQNFAATRGRFGL